MFHSPLETPEYRFQSIDLDFVDFPDNFLRFLYDDHIEQAALDPIRALGQIRPLPVHAQSNGCFHLLGEYTSFVAMKKLGLPRGIVQITPVSTPPLTLYAIQILHDRPAFQANPILQAHVLRQAQQNLTGDELPSLLALLGYSSNKGKIKDIETILDLAPEAVLALHRGILSLKTGRQLTRHTRDDQRCLVELISTYRLGGSKQQKLIELLTELTLRDQRPVRDFIAEWREGHHAQKENLPQQVQDLLTHLSAKNAPASTEAKEAFQAMVRQLRPPVGITIDHSLSFEDEQLVVHLNFASKKALMEKWEQLKTIMARGTGKDVS